MNYIFLLLSYILKRVAVVLEVTKREYYSLAAVTVCLPPGIRFHPTTMAGGAMNFLNLVLTALFLVPPLLPRWLEGV